MRKLVGVGKPRRLQGLLALTLGLLQAIWVALWVQTGRQMTKIGLPLRPAILPTAA